MTPRMPLRICVAVLLVSVVAAHASADSCLVAPVAISPNMVTSEFGKVRDLPQYGGTARAHWGVDFQARNPSAPSTGANIVAASSGTVIGAGFWGAGYGNRVVLKRDNGDLLLYSHLAKVQPELKSGGAIGFRSDTNGVGVGSVAVQAGDVVGIAGGTASHADSNERAIHLHLEYVTGYSGTKIRETNDGTTETRSHYMRNVLDYMCDAIARAPGAGLSGVSGPIGYGGSDSPNSASSPDQAAVAAAAQGTVSDRDRYGVPDTPPYSTYEGMSESQIVEAEALRRTLDMEWEDHLDDWESRGIWMEISRMDGALMWLDQRIAEKRQRIEAMTAMLMADEANRQFGPSINAARANAERGAASGRAK